MGRELATKIAALRRSLGDNQSEFGERFGVSQGSVSRWEKGSIPDPTILAKLADLASEDIRSFLGGAPQDSSFVNLGQRLMVKGSVAAGVWREAYEWPEDEWFSYIGGSHVSVPADRRFGLRVDGESMNEIYPPGTILDCVSIYEMELPASGRNVVVVRERHDGALEATVKQFYLDPAGKAWLLPKSTNPAFQTPIALDEPQADIAETRIIAIVVGSYRPE
jgi:transcriptional regulator with XRE-family HTH domain